MDEDLDTVDERMDLFKIRITSYQHRIAKYYNNNIRIRRFKVGDLVLKEVFQNIVKHDAKKLAPKWECPYLIDSKAGKGANWLSTLDG